MKDRTARCQPRARPRSWECPLISVHQKDGRRPWRLRHHGRSSAGASRSERLVSDLIDRGFFGLEERGSYSRIRDQPRSPFDEVEPRCFAAASAALQAIHSMIPTYDWRRFVRIAAMATHPTLSSKHKSTDVPVRMIYSCQRAIRRSRRRARVRR